MPQISQILVVEAIAAILFALAVTHTFATRYFEHLAHRQPAHAGLWHLFGEVEAVFGLWSILLIVAITVSTGWGSAVQYLDERQFIEPMFVFVIMVMAASRPILQVAADAVQICARAMPVQRGLARYFLGLSLVPLLGSLITEPAAMTLAALMLRDLIFSRGVSKGLKYGTLGVLFVNVSIGGVLTNFAAPPVLMVAAKWGWSSADMFAMLGWKAMIGVCFNAAVVSLLFRNEIVARADVSASDKRRVPSLLVIIHLVLLAGVVFANHHPEVFFGLFLMFLGLAEAYKRHHDRLLLREGLLVAFFLAGLVVLGGLQKWWLQPTLAGMSDTALFFGAVGLTAITDNAALTYLGSLVDGVTDEFKYSLVAGAVAGGGLTVIANAPNPAGFAILRDSFDDKAINPLGLLVAALPPTLVAVLLFRARPDVGEFFDLEAWGRWFEGVDRGFAFLLVLPVVVAVVGLWAESQRRRGRSR